MTRRKRRSDRNHIVYALRCGKLAYIGVTVLQGRAVWKSAQRRFAEHVKRALNEDKDWKLCRAIRKHGPEAFTLEVISVVRGKSAAHVLETKLIAKRKPSLNTLTKGWKSR